MNKQMIKSNEETCLEYYMYKLYYLNFKNPKYFMDFVLENLL